MRRLTLVLAVMATVLVSGAAAAAVLAGSRSSPSPAAGLRSHRNESSAQAEDAGIHGGSIERFHRANPCDLTDVSALPGNWTHGDYVATVAAGGNPVLIQRAAMSNCGKPMVAVEHGGPPAHALANMAAAQARAQAGVEHASEVAQGPPGS